MTVPSSIIQTDQLVTLDCISTRDIDDAISVERQGETYRIVVAIANVASLVKIGGREDAEASRIGATAYSRDRIVERMLPQKISENFGSLIANVARPAVVCEIVLWANLDVMSCKFAVQDIEVMSRLSYSDVQDILPDVAHEHHRMITLASAISRMLLSSRRKRGALALFDLSRLLVADEDGVLVMLPSREEAAGYIIVQELMILANTLLAQYFAIHDIPGIYRNHEPRIAAPSSAELATVIEGWLGGDGYSEDIIRNNLSMITSKSQYGESCKGHYGLCVPAYMHTTSPLRRYADLVNQRQLVAHLAGLQLPYDKTALAQISASLNESISRRKEERSEGFKAVVMRTAQKALVIGGLRHLADHELVAALRISRQANEIPLPLQEELADRLDSDTLTDKVMLALLYESLGDNLPEMLIAALCDWVSRFQARAPGFLIHGEKTQVLSHLVIRAIEDTKAPFVFEASAVMKEMTVTYRGEAMRKRDAEQLAAARLLCKVFGGSLPTQSSADIFVEQPGNAKGKLLELIQKRKWPSPVFSSEAVGVDHAPIFNATVEIVVLGRTYRAAVEGVKTKREAESSASTRLIELLEGVDGTSTAQEGGGRDNPFGQLLEYCQKHKIAPPSLQIVEGESLAGRFKCQLKLTGLPLFAGEGGTKQQAKHAAAWQALQTFVR